MYVGVQCGACLVSPFLSTDAAVFSGGIFEECQEVEGSGCRLSAGLKTTALLLLLQLHTPRTDVA